MIAVDALDELAELRDLEPAPEDVEAIRALRKIWLEAVMVETFEDVADLIQSAIS
jgi:hypothetical protein